MPGWITKARTVVTGNAGPAEPEPFELHCVCDETLAGERLPQAREIACPACGREWFILPRDPYPRRRKRMSKASLLSRAKQTGSTARIPTDADLNGKSSSSVTAAPRAGVQQPTIQQRINHRLTVARQSTRDRLKRAARPLRLVVVGIGLAFVATGLWLWHQARVDAASATIVVVVPQAEKALQDRDFARAEVLFAEAVEAVDLLDAKDATAKQVRQRYREVVAANNLAAQTPYDLAAEAEAMVANPSQWSERFKASIAGRWVVLDVPLGPPETPARDTPAGESEQAEPTSAQPAGKVHRIDLPLVAAKYPVRFEIAADVFKSLEAPDRAIFAAQYGSWELHGTSTGSEVWIVHFKPQTAFLWASTDIYASLGFDLDDPAAPPRATLELQAEKLDLPDQHQNEQASDSRG